MLGFDGMNMFDAMVNCPRAPMPEGEHIAVCRTGFRQPSYPARSRRTSVDMMRVHPLHQVLRQQVGIDTFAVDGDETRIIEDWSDKPRPRVTVAKPSW